MVKSEIGRISLGIVITLLAGCSRWSVPASVPDPALLGCYRLETGLPLSYADSLGYKLPDIIQLGHTEYGQWTVHPTDEEWHPDWTEYDDLPSGLLRRQIGSTGSPLEQHKVSLIPGDSVDIRFPSAIGRLILRVGRSGDDLAGRAEWVVRHDQLFLNEGVVVRALRTSCEGLQSSLVRTRFR